MTSSLLSLFCFDQQVFHTEEKGGLEAFRERIQQEKQLNSTIDVRAIEP